MTSKLLALCLIIALLKLLGIWSKQCHGRFGCYGKFCRISWDCGLKGLVSSQLHSCGVTSLMIGQTEYLIVPMSLSSLPSTREHWGMVSISSLTGYES